MAMVDSLTPLKIVACAAAEQAAAAAVLRCFSEQDLTPTDALGLHRMDARRTESCWSTDLRLSLDGARLVIHEH